MKKRKFKPTISKSQKILNPIIKYKKENNSFNQKVYKKRSKTSLFAYIKKEGNNFESKKKIKEDEGVKHLIISPISPEKYNELNEEEKEELKNVVIKNIYKDLSKYGFYAGIENKNREVNGKSLDHFHIHVAINSKYDISPKNVDYLKRSITRSIEANPNLKKKLGLETRKELFKKSYQKTYKKTFQKKYGTFYEKRENNFNELKIYFGDLKRIGEEIKTEYNEIKGVNYEVGELTKKRRIEVNTIERNKEFLKNDLTDTKDALKQRNNSLKNINVKFGELYNNFNNQKENIQNSIKSELNNLQNVLNDELFFFKNFVGNEHNIYIQFLKYQKKNKIIDVPTFLYLVANNKSYMKNRIRWKKEEIKNRIKEREKQLNHRLDDLKNRLEWDKYSLEFEKKNEENLKKYDEKKLKDLFNKMNELNKDKKNIMDNSFKKIEMLIKYRENRKKEIQRLHKEEMEKELEIDRKKRISKFENEKKEREREIKIKEKNSKTIAEVKIEIKKIIKISDKKLDLIIDKYLKEHNNNEIIDKEDLIQFIKDESGDGGENGAGIKRKLKDFLKWK